MVTSSIIKIISAFLAGLILVMGSALIYSRTRELAYPVHVVQAAPDPQPESSAQAQTPANDDSEQMDVPTSSQASSVPEQDSIPIPRTINPQYRQPVFQPIDAPSSFIAPQVPRPAMIQNTPSPVVPNRAAPASSPVVIANQITRPPLTQAIAQTTASSQQQTQYTPVQPAAQAAIQPAPAPRQPQTVTLQPGIQLTIKLVETLSTDRNFSGDTFRGTLESPVVANGFIIADKGSLVFGRIVNLQRAGLISGVSDLALQLSEINTTDGQRIRVDTTSWEKTGAKLKIRNTPRMAVGAAFGAVVGALSGAAKGAGLSEGFGEDSGTANVNGKHQRTVVVPIDSRLTFSLIRPVTITERLNYR